MQGAAAEGLRVLVVGASSVPRSIVARGISLAGYEVSTVATAAAAWNVLTAESIDVVMCESTLPDSSAIALCERIRSLCPFRYIYFVVLTPHAELARAAQYIRQGADDCLFYPVDRGLLESRLVVAHRVMALHRRLYDQARNDALTGVGNRLRMIEEVRILVDRCERYDEPFAVVLCDVDNFKRYNDANGHQAGDVALQRVASCLGSALRTSDQVYRYGGEEFVLLLPRQDAFTGRRLADRVRKAIVGMALPHELNPPWDVVTVSMGLAVHEAGETRHIDAVLKEADDALYRAKAAGRNCVVVQGDREEVGTNQVTAPL